MSANSLLLILAGIIAGIFAGFFGIGGGIVLVPLLVWFFGYTQRDAQGMSLAALLLPVGILGVWAYHKSHPIQIKSAIFIGLGIFIGAYFGGRFAQFLSDKTLKTAFGILMVVAGIKLILSR